MPYLILRSQFDLTTSARQVDASKTTGCFDLTCPGFVQTNHEIALGAAIYPISTPDGLPYQITIYIFKVWSAYHLSLSLLTCFAYHVSWIFKVEQVYRYA